MYTDVENGWRLIRRYAAELARYGMEGNDDSNNKGLPDPDICLCCSISFALQIPLKVSHPYCVIKAPWKPQA